MTMLSEETFSIRLGLDVVAVMAAGQGVPAAQYYLGVMLAMGVGVPQDHMKAYKWLKLAELWGPPTVDLFAGAKEMNLSMTGTTLEDVAREMTHAEISEAEDLVREWEPKSE